MYIDTDTDTDIDTDIYAKGLEVSVRNICLIVGTI